MHNINDPFDAMLKLVDSLGELEVVIGEKARPLVEEIRAQLRQGLAARERGDPPAALAIIASAMARLASFGSQLDPEEGAMMRSIAAQFTNALGSGDKGTVKQAVELMRHKAGDASKKDDPKW